MIFHHGQLKKFLCVSIAFVTLFTSLYCKVEANALNHWILILEPHDTQTVPIEISVQSGDLVVLHFIHSFNKMPVKETLVVTDDGMFELKEAEFTKLGAGYDTEPVSGNYYVENGKIHITEMNIRYPIIPLRIGTVAQHRLIVANQSYDLKLLFGGGKRIDIRLKPAR